MQLLGAVSRCLPGQTRRHSRAAIGDWGERRAANFLKRRGFRIITRNWRCGRDELDLVAWDGSVLVFVEVRTRQADALISGYDSINARKKRALVRACKAYMAGLLHTPRYFRFDVIEGKLGNDGQLTINHYENISLFPKHYLPPNR